METAEQRPCFGAGREEGLMEKTKEVGAEALPGRTGILAMSCDCQEAKNLLNLPGSGYTEWEKCERIGAGSKEAVISR